MFIITLEDRISFWKTNYLVEKNRKYIIRCLISVFLRIAQINQVHKGFQGCWNNWITLLFTRALFSWYYVFQQFSAFIWNLKYLTKQVLNAYFVFLIIVLILSHCIEYYANQQFFEGLFTKFLFQIFLEWI